jgi:hypothetical protein
VLAGDARREEIVERVLGLLGGLVDPLTAEPVCVWARRRAVMLAGRNVERFPDVLFELREGTGIDFGVFGPLFGADPMHRRISGGHRKDGVFAATRADFDAPESVEDVHDVVVTLTTRS